MPGQRGPVPVAVASGNRDITKEILETLDSESSFTTDQKFPDVGQIEIKAALDRLASRSMISYDTKDSQVVILTEEGEQISREGSHEFKVSRRARGYVGERMLTCQCRYGKL